MKSIDNSIVQMKSQRVKLLRIPEATYEALEEISKTSPVDDTDPVDAIRFLIRYFHITRCMLNQYDKLSQELLFGGEEEDGKQ